MTYHYTMCGLDYVYLSDGYTRRETPYGSGVTIKNADSLDKTIALCVLISPARIRGQEVRFLRSLMDVSQAEMAKMLGMKRVTVARWEGSPKTPIPGPADRILRVLAAKKIFAHRNIVMLVIEGLAEIGDERPADLYMTHIPNKNDEQPSMFADNDDGPDGWKPTKTAFG